MKHIIGNLSGHYLITPRTDEGGDTTWCYHEDLGIFKPDGGGFIKKLGDEALGPKAKTAYINEALFLVRIRTYVPREEFIEEPGLIVLKNGVLNLETGEIQNHSPIHFAKTALPVNYDPTAECPMFLKFLERVAPTYIGFIQEWFGYHLLKDQRFQRFIILLGDGDNGKSTLLHVLTSFLGTDNVATQSLYNLSTNRFSCAHLYGKLANIVSDIGPDEIKHTGALKIATGEDRGFAEKKFKDGFTFVNYAKLSFSCNQLPKTPDETRAFYKRAIYLTFDTIIPVEEQDEALKEKLTTPEELSGILNWALEGLRRAQERHRLDEPTTIEERRTGYRRLSDPVASFAEDRLIEDIDEWETKGNVYRAFAQYCKDTGFTTPSDASFFKDLKKDVYYHTGSKTISKQRTKVILGVKLLGAARGTRGTRGTITKGNLTEYNKREDPVQVVQPVQTPEEDQLFTDARTFLEVNGGTMTQRLLFSALTNIGYNQAQASEILRADPRLAFRGLDVRHIDTQKT